MNCTGNFLIEMVCLFNRFRSPSKAFCWNFRRYSLHREASAECRNSWSRILLEKLIDAQLVKNIPYLLWNSKIHVFRSLPLDGPLSEPNKPNRHSRTQYLSILILSYHAHLSIPSGIFPSLFSTKILYVFLISPTRIKAPPISVPFIVQMISYEK